MKVATKLLALAAPAALLLSSPAPARAGGPARAPAPVHAVATRAAAAAPLAAFAALLRVAAAAATTAPSQPMCGADGRPLAGNMNKGAHACSAGERVAAALAGDEPRG
jgi:hypothetical protein